MEGKMDLRVKIEEVGRAIEFALGSDDVAGIIRTLVDDLINANLTGLRLYLTMLENKRKESSSLGRKKIEDAIVMVEHFGKILGMDIPKNESS